MSTPCKGSTLHDVRGLDNPDHCKKIVLLLLSLIVEYLNDGDIVRTSTAFHRKHEREPLPQ